MSGGIRMARVAAAACLVLLIAVAAVPSSYAAEPQTGTSDVSSTLATPELCKTCSDLASSAPSSAAPVTECIAGPSPQCCDAIKAQYSETELACLCFQQVRRGPSSTLD